MRTTRRRKPATLAERPSCEMPVSQSVDIGVMRHIRSCGSLLGDCDRWLRSAPGGDDAAEAQRDILLNLAHCLSETAYGMVTLLNHNATGAVLVLERAAIEYYGRASYFMKDPDHALWYARVEHLQALIDAETTSPEARIALIRQIIDARRKHFDLTPEARTAAGKQPFDRIRISEMVRIGLGEDAARRYASTSKVLHGDLNSSQLINNNGPQAANVAVLEAASAIVAFCNLMLSWLLRAPNGLTGRILDAEHETLRLQRRYRSAHLIA